MKTTKRIISVIMVLAMLIPSLVISASAATVYTVTFNANGGAGAPAAVEVNAGKKYTIPSAEPKKDGMVFRGWALSHEDAAMGNVAYSRSAKYGGEKAITVNSDITLYAVWAYSVLLKCGPEGKGSNEQLYKYPAKVLELEHIKKDITSNYGLNAAKGSSDQRTFIEWNTAYNATTGRGTGVSYYDSYAENKAVTLYAIWGYNIQFNGDGAVYPSTGNDEYLTYVASYNLQNQSDPKTDYSYCIPELFNNTPVKEGCRRVLSNGRPSYALLNNDMTFFCWETPDQNLTIPPKGGYLPWSDFNCAETEKGTAPEFYAIWEPSVSYKPNGGSGSSKTEYLTWTGDALHDYEDYTIMTEASANNRFTKDGATVIGWNTKRDGSGESYSFGKKLTSFDDSDPIVLYAQWSDGSYNTKAHTYTVTYNVKGGTGTPETQTKTDGVDLALSTFVPAKTGYTFLGWSDSYAADSVAYLPGASYREDADISLYAVWTAHNAHNCTAVVASAATCVSEGIINYTCTDCGIVYTGATNMTGHSYGAWRDNGNGTQSKACVCGDTITENCVYSITYLDMDGRSFSGIHADGAPATHTYGTATSLKKATREGYTFGGWYTEAGKKVTSLAKKAYTDDITLYAKWTANKYKITYKDYNNKSFTGKHPSGYSTYHYYDTDTVLLNPTRKNYTFLGWYTDKACTQPIEVIGGQDITAAITVYAKWEKN